MTQAGPFISDASEKSHEYLSYLIVCAYRISANSFRGKYSFFGSLDATIIQGRKVFKGGNYSRKYGIW